jgi:cysteinyl-tRNA synthetase
MMSNKVLRHPEKEAIIAKLASGASVKEVERWLQKKHPKSKRLQISYMTLQKFRKEYLNIEGDMLEHIKSARSSAIKQSEETEKNWLVHSSNAYQDKLNEIVSQELDVTQKMLEMEKLISSRIEFYFNVLNTDGGNLREEKMFLDLLAAQRELLRDWKKYVEGVADKTIDHNINITVMNQQISVLKSIVFEVLQGLDPSLIPLFVEKVNARLGDTNYESEEYRTYYSGVIDAE